MPVWGDWFNREAASADTDREARELVVKDRIQSLVTFLKSIQQNCFDTFQKMYARGVNIAMGTDMGFDPEMGTNARELGLYVDLGMQPMHALQTATLNAARAL
jgi:imidazolonepropionase-like amidohydrolase